MKFALVAALVTTLAAPAALAQDFGTLGGRVFSLDLGLGVTGRSTYPGSDDAEAAPWLIWRNAGFGDAANPDAAQGFALSPAVRSIGERESSDDASLAGMPDIDTAYELGLRASYGMGPVTTYGAVRRGFDGHEGFTGEIGAKYRTDLSPRLTLWSGMELGYGDSEFTNTYFGVTPDQAAPGRPAYSLGGGFSSAAITFEARYKLTEKTSLLGEVQYGKLIGDAADSPVVQDEYQPVLRVGIVRRMSFGF